MWSNRGGSKARQGERTTTRRGLASLASAMACGRAFNGAWFLACGV